MQDARNEPGEISEASSPQAVDTGSSVVAPARTGSALADRPATTVARRPLTEEQILKGFTSSVPWQNDPADCVVICCSDPRFEKQNEDFVSALGFSQPHFMQIPSGLAVFASLVAAAGFLHKGMGLLLKKAIELTGVETVICIGHEDCGGYKAGKYRIVQSVSRRLAGKPVRDIQHDHLKKAGRTISRQLGSGVEVRVFYADVVQGRGDDHVKYAYVGSWGRKRELGVTTT